MWVGQQNQPHNISFSPGLKDWLRLQDVTWVLLLFPGNRKHNSCYLPGSDLYQITETDFKFSTPIVRPDFPEFISQQIGLFEKNLAPSFFLVLASSIHATISMPAHPDPQHLAPFKTLPSPPVMATRGKLITIRLTKNILQILKSSLLHMLRLLKSAGAV